MVDKEDRVIVSAKRALEILEKTRDELPFFWRVTDLERAIQFQEELIAAVEEKRDRDGQ